MASEPAGPPAVAPAADDASRPAPLDGESLLDVLDDPAADDTGLDLSFAGPEPSPAASLLRRTLDVASAYVPLIVMAVVAAATWWLVQNAPQLDAPRAAPVARVDPDVTMTGVRIQRFAPDGRLRTQIEGERLRHFPATDTLEIDAARIRSIDAAGRVTVATAKRALSNADGSEVQLLGDAQVVREPTGDEQAIRFNGEFLHAFRNAEQLRSHLPVTVTQGDSVVRAGGMRYDHGTRTVDLPGRTRATFAPRRAATPATPTDGD
jgi:lipopolysaccharide export system protein LptC